MEKDGSRPVIEEPSERENEEITPPLDISGQDKTLQRSVVWEHYRQVTETIKDTTVEFGYCNYCPKKYKYCERGASKSSKKGLKRGVSSSTGNMLKHLREKHQDLQLNIKEGNTSENTEFIFSQENYRIALLKWIIESDQCLKEPEQPAFLEFVRSLNPYAEEVSSTTLQKDLMELYSEQEKSVKLKLSQVQGKLSFTVASTMRNKQSFLKISAHWIDNWVMRSDLLDCCYVPDKNFMCDIFLDCLNRYEIPISKILGITLKNVLDNETFINCLQNKGIESGVHFSSIGNFVECLLYIANSSVEALLKSLKCLPDNQEEGGDSHDKLEKFQQKVEMIPAITTVKLRYLMEIIRSSHEMQKELKEMCSLMGVEFNVPVVDDESNSAFKMIERAVQLKEPLRALCIKLKPLSQLMISETEWSELSTLKDLLTKFYRAMNFGAMNFVPISSYLATLNWLIDSLESLVENNDGFLAEAFKICLENIKKHDLNITKSKIPFVTTLLNPALKMSYFKEHNYSKSEMKDIEKRIYEIFKKDYEVKENISTEKSEDEDDEFFSHMFKRPKIEKLSREFQKYLRYPLSPPKVDILEFWKLNEAEFPCLSNMARDFLGAASSLKDLNKEKLEEESVTPEQVRASICLGYWLKNN